MYHKSLRVAQVREITTFEKGCWVYLVKPTPQEIDDVSSMCHVSKDLLTAPLDSDEQPRIEQENGNILLIIRTPNVVDNSMYEILPLGIILTQECIITVCLTNLSLFNEFIETKQLQFATTQKIRFLMQIFQKNNRQFQKHVNIIEKHIEGAENRIMKTQSNEEIASLLFLQKTIMYFHTAVLTNNKMFAKLVTLKGISIYEQDQELLKDIIVDNEQILESLSIFNNILSNTMDAYASIISNNLNIVMKFLASFTIILSIPTIIASFYGMNVHLPIEEHQFAFYFILIISAAIMLVFVYFFNKKKYF